MIDGKLGTLLYIKPTDPHPYFHCLPFHPEQTERSMVYKQTLPVKRLYFLKKDFNYHILNMEWFIKQGMVY